MKTDSRLNRPQSVVLSLFIYVLAIITAIFVARLFSGYHPLVMIGAADLAATVLVFVFSMALNNSSAYDPYWSVKPLVIAIAYLYIFDNDPITLRQAFLLTGTALYAFRLTLNFYRDWPGFKHEDWRYGNFRVQFPKNYWLVSFLGIHLFPTIMVYLGCLPMYAVFETSGEPWNGWDIAATVVLFGSVLLAFTADEQVRVFRKDLANKGKTMTLGLWRISRHPNYLGEILTWWGLFLYAIGAGYDNLWTIAGPASITLMFVFASIPMIEKRHKQNRVDYMEYVATTSMLIPFKFKSRKHSD